MENKIRDRIKVGLAQLEQLEELAELFDRYRMFYQQPSNTEAARYFLQERLEKSDSTIFVAITDGQIVGFTQLYPSFSSVSMKRIWILNDLFVRETDRNQGVAKLLMNAAADFARETAAIRIVLSTQISNNLAQAFYESYGYTKNEEFYQYQLTL
jgi:ribosomal protein S18 acetylase RimI-like enzyme